MRKRIWMASVAAMVTLFALLQASFIAWASSPLDDTPSEMISGTNDSLDAALGDFDNDGDLDLASYGENNVVVYENINGELGGTAVWTSTESTCTSGRVMWADINNDDYPEQFASQGIYENSNGALSATAVRASLSTADVFELGDVNGDGFVDLLLGRTGLVELYESSAGTVDEIPDWNTTEENSPRALALWDPDNDNFDEIVVGNSESQPMRIYDNVGGSLGNISI